MEEQKNEQHSEEKEVKTKGKSKKPWMLLVLLIGLLVVAGAYYWYIEQQATEDSERPAVEREIVQWVDRGIDEEDFPIFQQRVDDLLAEIEEVEAEGERDVNLYLRLGNAYYTIGELGLAVEQYDEILSTHPNDVPAFENKGQALYEMGDIEGAEVAWRKAIEFGAQEHVYFNLAELIREEFPERTDEILGLLESGIETHGQTTGFMIEIGNWYRDQEQYDQAISHYQVAYQLSGQSPAIKKQLDELIEERAEYQERQSRLNQ